MCSQKSFGFMDKEWPTFGTLMPPKVITTSRCFFCDVAASLAGDFGNSGALFVGSYLYNSKQIIESYIYHYNVYAP